MINDEKKSELFNAVLLKYSQRGVSRIRGYQYVIFLIVVENPVLSVTLRTMTPYVRSRFIKGLVKTFTKVSRTFPTHNL